MTIEAAITHLVAEAERGARALATATAKQGADIRKSVPQLERLLVLAAQVGARDRLLPAIGIMTDALTEHRRVLDEVIAELARLAPGAVPS